MINASIHSITRSTLLSMGLPIHWYADVLKFGLDCLNEELGFTILPNIKSARLTVNANKEIELPDDYVDWIRVGYQYGQHVVPMTKESRFNRMLPDSGNSYSSIGDILPVNYSAYYYGLHSNSYGELNGRYFGSTAQSQSKFIEVRERSVIAVDASFAQGDTIVVDYIYFDSATATALVHPKASPVIRDYCIWKMKEMSRGLTVANRFEVDKARVNYYRSLRMFRAQIQSITIEGVLEAIRSTQRLSPKV